MDCIIEQLKKTDIIINALNDDEKKIFLTKFNSDITEIEQIIQKINNELLKLKLSETKCELIEKQNNKDKIIAQTLFPYYWILSEAMSN